MACVMVARVTDYTDEIAAITLFIKGDSTVRSYSRMKGSLLEEFVMSKVDHLDWRAKQPKPAWANRLEV